MNTTYTNSLQSMIRDLEELISITESKEAAYLNENKTVDSYVMGLNGQINGYKTAIALIKMKYMGGW
jgi:hypothetical protein